MGAGAFVGGVVVSVRLKLRRAPSFLLRTTSITAVALVVFSFSTNLLLSLAAAFFMGFGITSTNISVNTLCQTTTSDDCRSRVISLYIMCTAGFGPVGGLAFGALADFMGAPHTMLLCALVIALAILLFLRHFHAIHHSLAQTLAHLS